MRKNVDKLRERIKKFDLATSAFVVIATVIGLFFAFSTPILWGADETTHVGRVYQLSHGKLFSTEVHEGYSNYGYGGHIPITLKEAIDYVNRDFNVNGLQDVRGVRWVDNPSDYDKFLNYSMQAPLVEYNFSNTAIYSPLSYTPSVLAFMIAALTNLNVGPSIFLGRIFDLAFYILLVGAAIYALRTYKTQWLFFVIALMPTNIYQASIITADTVTTAVSFTLIALTTKAFLTRTRLSKFETYLLLAAAFLIPITKPTYMFLSLVILFIPLKKLALSKYARQIVIGIVIAGIVLYLAWQFKTSYLSNASKWIIAGGVPWWQNIDSAEQLKYVLGHPFEFIKGFFRSILIFDDSWLLGISGRLGFTYMVVSGVTQVIVAACIGLALLISDKFKVAKRIVLSFAGIATMSVLAIFGTFYLTISEVGQLTIEGVQGRYFMPVLPLVFLVIVMLVRARIEDRSHLAIQKALIVMMAFGLAYTSIRFLYVIWG